MTTSPPYEIQLTGFIEELTSPTVFYPVNAFLENLTSPTVYNLNQAFVNNSTSPVYEMELNNPERGLRGAQFEDNEITLSKFNSAMGYRIAVVNGVDLTATGTTALYAPASGENVFVLGVILQAITGSATTDASVGVGTNGAFDNIFSETVLSQFQDAQDVFSLWSGGVIDTATDGETITLEVTVAASGTLTADIHLIGFIL